MSLYRAMKELMGPQDSMRGASQRQTGPMIAVVTNNVDPEDRYRVKVKFPWLDDTLESFWARIGTGMGGTGEMGSFFLPEVGDEVICVFQDGDPEQPIITGSLWNGVDKSPRDVDISPDDVNEKVPNNQQGGKNDFRFIRSRMKHHLLFKDREAEGAISVRTAKKNEIYLDDKDGAEKIQVYDMNRTQWLEIDVVGKKITMETDTGEILIKAKTKITMDCEDLIVKASKTIKVDSGTSSEWAAGSSLKWTAGSTANYESGGATTVKGAKIDLNP